MQKLIEGIHKFRQDELGKYQALFHRLSSEGQNPHTLFITCSDSRVVAELITHSRPGDLFVVKNVGNIVPPENARGPNSTAAAIEFAVQTLHVKDIVICGHSHCGAMESLLSDIDNKEKMPHLHEWLEIAAPVRRLIENKYSHLREQEKRLSTAAQENVLLGIENLKTYPFINTHLKEGTLHLHAWFFKIATAEMFAYDLATQQFQLIEEKSSD